MAKLFVFGRDDNANKGYNPVDIKDSHFYYRNMTDEIIFEYKHRYITKNTYAYTYMEDHLLLRPKEVYPFKIIEDFTDLGTPHLLEYCKINKEYKDKGYHIYENPKKYRSVKKVTCASMGVQDFR